MPKSRLFTPGPTFVPEAALSAMSRQAMHHRTPEFRRILAEVLAGLKEVFVTRNEVLLLSSSGTGAMEAAVVNLVPRGGKAVVLDSGKFAGRWRILCETFGIRAVRYELPWGAAFEPARVAALLREHADAAAVFATLMETSTGVGHDIAGISRAVKENGEALFVVDGISGVGAMECRTDEWGIDVLAVGSQKALMTPPGLAFLAVSPAAWRRIEANPKRPAFYFDLLAYREALSGGDTPYTPAIPLVLALAESLKTIRARGMEAIWAKTRLLAAAFRAGIEALGLKLAAARPADGMTAVFLPEGIDGKTFLDRLEKRFGIKLAGGQGPWKGKIFRMAHFGLIDELDVLATLTAVELLLLEFGITVKPGAAVAAGIQCIAESGRS
ncbi:MAG: alanine--glyoxylate aminotransferase family protein [Pirellulales bacterium]|nr:alanine--glyoxylate aminotransferase family protein [Pirellulales bacterium]